MADIDVERKGGMGWLWWVLGLILLAMLLWLIFEVADDDEAEVAMEEPVATAPVVTPGPVAPVDAAVPAAVGTYLTQCTEEQGAPQQEMGLQHQFTVNCLQQLREGMNALIAQEQVANTDVSARFDQYTSTVQQLQGSDPANVTHANMTRDAAGIAVQVMQAMEAAWFAGDAQIQSAVGEVQQAAEGIQGEVPMLEQRESVHAFFREAGDALRMMAETRTAVPAA